MCAQVAQVRPSHGITITAPADVSGQLTGTAAVRLYSARSFARKSTIGAVSKHLLLLA